MDVGQRLIDRLIAHGVRRVFGVPGGQTAPFYHGIATRQGQIDHVLMRDERSAAFAADAYARATGTVGVCDATVGPGATNLVSGLVEAYSSSIPVVAVIADIPRAWEHRRRLGSASQGFEQRAFLAPCVKWFGRVDTPEQLDATLDHCLRVATSNRPGPVIIEIPDDVFSSPALEVPHPESLSGVFPRLRSSADPAAVAAAAELLRRARRPMLLVGGGAQISRASAEVRALSERLGAPVATTISGKGIIAETHPLAVGVSGSFGSAHANETIEQADCLVVIGSKLGQAATLGWDIPQPGTEIVHIDVDAEEIGRNNGSTLGIQGDAKLATKSLVEALGAHEAATAWEYDSIAARTDDFWESDVFKHPVEGDRIKPQHVLRVLGAELGDDDVIVTDASLSSGWAASRWRVSAPGRRLIAPRGLAGLGWGLPAAIGAAFGLRDAGHPGRVVCLAGDGGWGYSLSEIETLARFRIALPSIVLNNKALAWNKHVAMRRYPDAWVSQDLLDVRYADAAIALGAFGVRVDDANSVGDAIRAALAETQRPSVVEISSSEHETPVLKAMSGTAAPMTAYV
jgi:acetolactate synthase I/II/III large subunit